MARLEAPAVFTELLNNDKSRIVRLALNHGVFSNVQRFAQSLMYRAEDPIIPEREDAYATFYGTLKSAWHYAGRPEIVFFDTSVREIEEFCGELFDYGSKRDFRTFLAINDALFRQTGHFTDLLTKIETDSK